MKNDEIIDDFISVTAPYANELPGSRLQAAMVYLIHLREKNRKLLIEREQILGLGFKDFDKNTLALTIEWYINRLVVIHGEHQNADFIVKGREIVDMLLNIEMAPRHQPPTSE